MKSGRPSCDLLGINVRIFEKSDCEKAYGRIDSHFCAGTGGGKDSCQVNNFPKHLNKIGFYNSK